MPGVFLVHFVKPQFCPFRQDTKLGCYESTNVVISQCAHTQGCLYGQYSRSAKNIQLTPGKVVGLKSVFGMTRKFTIKTTDPYPLKDPQAISLYQRIIVFMLEHFTQFFFHSLFQKLFFTLPL